MKHRVSDCASEMGAQSWEAPPLVGFASRSVPDLWKGLDGGDPSGEGVLVPQILRMDVLFGAHGLRLMP